MSRRALSVALGAALAAGCALAHERATCDEPHDVYHAATRTIDRCPETFADVEATYRAALERLGGCPGYLYRDEWCAAIDAPFPAPESAAWQSRAWATIETCRDLYWTRGAYCHAIDEGAIAPELESR